MEEPARLDRVDEVGGRGTELEGRVRLAGAGLARDENGPVVAPESQQVTARVEDRDGSGDTGCLRGGASSGDERFRVLDAQRSYGGLREGGGHEGYLLGAMGRTYVWWLWGCQRRASATATGSGT